MIIALEGPNRCGKSTLIRELRKKFTGWIFIERVPTPVSLLGYMEYVELMQEGLMRQLYDPRLSYISDRNFCVSSLVYSKYYGRPSLINVDPWLPALRVIYLNVPTKVLQVRNNESTHPNIQVDFDRLKSIYVDTLPRFQHVVIDGSKSKFDVFELTSKAILDFCKKV